MNQSNKTRSADPGAQPRQQYQPGPSSHPQLAGMEAAPIARTFQFWISHKSKMDGNLYEGQFTCKKMSIKDLASIGVHKVQLNGGYYHDENKPGFGIDPQTDWLNSMIAHLELALIQTPLWFVIEDIIDGEILSAVFTKVMEFENSFFRSSGKQAGDTGSSPDTSSPQGTETGAAGSVTPLVGGQVPSSLDP